MIKWARQLVSLMVAALLVSGTVAPVAAAQSTRDFDSNAIIWGGIGSPKDLVAKIKSGNNGRNPDLAMIFAHHGIANADILSSDTVPAIITKDGRVLVSGKLKATGAMSMGRHKLPGSVKVAGVWQRPTSVSFAADALPGWAHMKDGQFHWAVIGSCGNPVVAKPVAQALPPQGKISKGVGETNATHTPPAHVAAADDAENAFDVAPGAHLTYVVKITNSGKTNLTNVRLTDNLPAGVVWIPGGSNTPDPHFRRMVTDFPLIAPGKSETAILNVMASSDSAGKVIDNKACFTSNNGKVQACDHAVIKVAGGGQVSVTPPAAQPQLPVAGAPAMAGGFMGASVLGYAGRHYLRTRRALRAALLFPRP